MFVNVWQKHYVFLSLDCHISHTVQLRHTKAWPRINATDVKGAAQILIPGFTDLEKAKRLIQWAIRIFHLRWYSISEIIWDGISSPHLTTKWWGCGQHCPTQFSVLFVSAEPLMRTFCNQDASLRLLELTWGVFGIAFRSLLVCVWDEKYLGVTSNYWELILLKVRQADRIRINEHTQKKTQFWF